MLSAMSNPKMQDVYMKFMCVGVDTEQTKTKQKKGFPTFA
jgi:hypothetical protein